MCLRNDCGVIGGGQVPKGLRLHLQEWLGCDNPLSFPLTTRTSFGLALSLSLYPRHIDVSMSSQNPVCLPLFASRRLRCEVC